MRLGIISGSGSDRWPGLVGSPRSIATPYGTVDVTEGRIGDADVVHLSRHGPDHARTSTTVTHRANIAALLHAGVDAVIAVTICGSVDRALAPGTVVVFDDLHFPTNRLPDGSPCTWYDQPGDPQRGHWIFDRPFSAELREALVTAAASQELPIRTSGCYGHVDGPRFNSRTEIAALAAIGVSAVSQTAGPEVVLAGEAELPYALVGFVTDYANGVAEVPEPIDALVARMRESTGILAALLAGAFPTIRAPKPAGFVYRFEAQASHQER